MGIWSNLQKELYEILDGDKDPKVYDYVSLNLPFPYLVFQDFDVDTRSGADRDSQGFGDGAHVIITLAAYTGQEQKGFAVIEDMIEDAICTIENNLDQITGLVQLTTTGYSGRRIMIEEEPIWVTTTTIDIYLS